MSKEFLSETEIFQLGKPKEGSTINYLTPAEWQVLRPIMVAESLRRNPYLREDMIAYTPGETLLLLQKPEIKKWHKDVVNFEIPKKYKQIILVPCAKTKPWDKEHSKKSVGYRAYHEILAMSESRQIPPVYFVTISEPLGVVPQDFWANFPQYDNPGLFKEDYLRTGMYNTDWVRVVGKRRHLPFDDEAYIKSIKILGNVISKFLEKNSRGRRILSFVDAVDRIRTTHGDMLTYALGQLGGTKLNLERYTKKRVPREAPLNHILSKIK